MAGVQECRTSTLTVPQDIWQSIHAERCHHSGEAFSVWVTPQVQFSFVGSYSHATLSFFSLSHLFLSWSIYFLSKSLQLSGKSKLLTTATFKNSSILHPFLTTYTGFGSAWHFLIWLSTLARSIQLSFVAVTVLLQHFKVQFIHVY